MSMKMTMAEFVGLELCPFCGGEAEMLTAESMNGGYLFAIMCNDCCSRGDVYDTEAEAIEAWNSRAERTCVPTEDGCCPYCGDDLIKCDMAIGEGGGAVELDPPIYHNYCPNCGAKVVVE